MLFGIEFIIETFDALFAPHDGGAPKLQATTASVTTTFEALDYPGCALRPGTPGLRSLRPGLRSFPARTHCRISGSRPAPAAQCWREHGGQLLGRSTLFIERVSAGINRAAFAVDEKCVAQPGPKPDPTLAGHATCEKGQTCPARPGSLQDPDRAHEDSLLPA